MISSVELLVVIILQSEIICPIFQFTELHITASEIVCPTCVFILRTFFKNMIEWNQLLIVCVNAGSVMLVYLTAELIN